MFHNKKIRELNKIKDKSNECNDNVKEEDDDTKQIPKRNKRLREVSAIC